MLVRHLRSPILLNNCEDCSKRCDANYVNTMKSNLVAGTPSNLHVSCESMGQRDKQQPDQKPAHVSASRKEFTRRVEESTRLAGCDAGCMAGD